ncbi:hypothetical protein EB796_019735 [Bugula neritina]|uniref:Uncharacterized protein n=1 Tax=Bugula neritina TaxID=10212 RepID=A0A7J7J8H5_BUGNE|nr:hypothetical protein EB796_019735 [Bugula neritina]
MSNERLPNHELYANHKGFCEEMTPEERIKAEKQECLERLKKLSAQERNMSTKQLEEAETNLREDLHSWLATQISDTREGIHLDILLPANSRDLVMTLIMRGLLDMKQ